MLRDRFDIVTPAFRAQENTKGNANQPYGGTFQQSFSYGIASVRIDNYSNRWLYFDSEGFVIPPFTHGFIINLFTQQQGLTIKSVKSPFGPLATNYAGDFNPKSVSSPFPVGVLVSVYDDVQPQLNPQTLVRLDNALIEPVLGNTTGAASTSAPNPITGIGSPGNSGFPLLGSLLLPTFSIAGFFEFSELGRATVGDRAISQSVGGKLAVLAGIDTPVVDADQPQAFQGTLLMQRLFRALVSADVAGDIDLVDGFAAVSGSRGSFATVTVLPNVMVPIEFGRPGYLINDGNSPPGINVFQFRHSANATITYTLEWAVK